MLEKRHSVSRQDGEELKQAVNTRQVFTKLTESPLSCISIQGIPIQQSFLRSTLFTADKR